MTRYSRIIGTGGYLPESVLTNADLERLVDTSDTWIVERTGIKERRMLAEHETTSSMAEAATRLACEAAGIAVDEIELLILTTSTPDRVFPATACLLQHRLGMTKHIPAFDISAACSGFIYALSIADQYIRSGSIKTALVVGADSLTRIVDWSDRGTCILFSDGAGAVVLRVDEEPGILSTHLRADGQYHELLYCANQIGELRGQSEFIRMKGREVFKIAVNLLVEIAEEALDSSGIRIDQLDWLIPHQANLRILQAVAKRLGLPPDKLMVTVEHQGNTSAASIPLALDIGVRDGRIKRGQTLLLEAFGGGLTWGAALLHY